MIYASWRTNAKLVWGLPRQSKNYFLKFLMPDTVPPNVALLTKFHKFFHGLLDSPSPEIQLVCRLSARDLRTNLGKNVKYLKEESGLDPWVFGAGRIKSELLKRHLVETQECDSWRLPYLGRLLSERFISYYNGDEQQENYLNTLIYSLVTS